MTAAYDLTLSNIFNNHASIINKQKIVHNENPWYSNTLKDYNIEKRKAERPWIRSGDVPMFQLFEFKLNDYIKECEKVKSRYVDGKVLEYNNDTRKLFWIVEELFKPMKN